MSATRPLQRQFDCAYDGCEAAEPASGGPVDAYCSAECAARDRGETLLEHLAQDHRFCASCYRPRKTVYRPADRESPKLRTKALVIRESFVGFEELTEFADEGAYGIECACGTVNHDAAEPVSRDGEPYEYWLKRAVQQLREEDHDVGPFSIETFADAFWQGDDFAVAVGRALQDSP